MGGGGDGGFDGTGREGWGGQSGSGEGGGGKGGGGEGGIGEGVGGEGDGGGGSGLLPPHPHSAATSPPSPSPGLEHLGQGERLCETQGEVDAARVALGGRTELDEARYDAHCGGWGLEGRRRLGRGQQSTARACVQRGDHGIICDEMWESLMNRRSGDQVDISTHFTLCLSTVTFDMKLVSKQRHSFITQPGTTNGTNGVKTGTFPI